MARKLPRLQRVLDAPALFSIAYGEIASSIYFALGIIAFHALGLSPAVLLVVGALFLLVSLSYAEGTAATRETGGAATLVRLAFNDLWGFVTGWVLFLDYLIVIALSALFVPHYVAGAFFMRIHRPWDVVAGCCVIAGIAVVRLVHRTRLHRWAILVAIVDLVTQLLLVVLGFALLFSSHALTRGTSLGHSPSWHSVAFSLPLAMLAYTGLETVANLAEETRRPGRDLPRSLFSAIVVGAPLQVFVGLSGALILLMAATTSISGFGRLAYSLGEHGQLPAPFGRLNRRTLVAPVSIVSAAVVSVAILGATSLLHDRVSFLASLFSFGVLLAFTSAQLAVIRLRMTRPDLRRPFRVPFEWRGMPVPSVVGALATAAVFVDAMITHRGARYGGPVWLLIGLAVYLMVRRERGAGLLETVQSSDEQVLPEAEFSRILVPMKLGEIGEEMVATAVKLPPGRAPAGGAPCGVPGAPRP